MNDQEIRASAETESTAKEIHPLIKLSVLTVGTKIGAELILKLAKYPVLLFGMGIAAGLLINRNQDDIKEALEELGQQGLKMIKKQPAED